MHVPGLWTLCLTLKPKVNTFFLWKVCIWRTMRKQKKYTGVVYFVITTDCLYIIPYVACLLITFYWQFCKKHSIATFWLPNKNESATSTKKPHKIASTNGFFILQLDFSITYGIGMRHFSCNSKFTPPQHGSWVSTHL